MNLTYKLQKKKKKKKIHVCFSISLFCYLKNFISRKCINSKSILVILKIDMKSNKGYFKKLYIKTN